MYTRMLFFEEKDLLKYEKGDRAVLFHIKLVSYCEYRTEHDLCYNKLLGRVSHLSQKPVFCFGLCRERCGPHRSLELGKRGGTKVYLDRCLLCCVSCERRLRLFQLDVDEKASNRPFIRQAVPESQM